MTPRPRPTPAAQPRAHRPARSRASVYILVLGASLMVAAAGLAAVSIARASTRSAVLDRDAAEAASAATSGLDLLLAQINSTSSWRTAITSGGSIGPITIGRAKVVLTVIDESDGNLSNDPTQPVRLYAAARVGNAYRTHSVQAVTASAVGLDVLRTAVHAAGTVTVSRDVPVVGGPLSSNTSLSNSAVLTDSVEAPSVSSSGFISGTVSITAAKTMPTDAGWNALAAAATAISPGTIDNQLLGPGVNTVGGGANARGIYLINVPALSTLTVRRSRINACLLVNLGASAKLLVEDENLFDAPEPRLPTLLIKGGLLSSVEFKLSDKTQLKESDAGRNFNPAGCPYLGTADADQIDSYPNAVTGLVHVLTNTPVTLNIDFRFAGCFITAGTATINNSGNTFAAQPTLLSAPPTGYEDPAKTTMQMNPGTFRWEVAP